jgi:F-type H+-transporting ATPase subunit delta
MPSRLSRRSVAAYVASGLVIGIDKKLLLTQLAAFLVESNRTKELDLIVRDIEYNLAEKGFVNATITSAFDLTAETKKALEVFIKNKTLATQVSLTNVIDPAVLGGIKIATAGRELDQTVTRQLTVLKTRLRKA